MTTAQLNPTRTKTNSKQTTGKKTNMTVVNMLLNTFTFTAFMAAMQPHATGQAIHEWGSLALTVALLMHMALHWEWITGISNKLLGKLPTETRLNYLLNLAFYIDMTLIVLSGLMMSKNVLPAFGIHVDEHAGPWHRLHILAADSGLVILALHVAMHRKWVTNTFRKYVWARLPFARKTA